jgi:hypothetical protein
MGGEVKRDDGISGKGEGEKQTGLLFGETGLREV